MRVLLPAVAVALLLGASTGAQLPPPSQMQEIQERVRKLAESEAEKLRDRVRATTLGTLNPSADTEVRKWDAAVRLWKQEKGAGAGPLLAEGVLFDCLGRLQGVKTRRLFGDVRAIDFSYVASERPAVAAKLFDAALKFDPALVEARLRAARIRAPKNSQAVRELERLAGDQSGAPFSYLAAISRAETARAHRDVAGAIRWYERSLELRSRSTAATIALSSLRPAAALPFDSLDADDLYYTYPCTILTSDVATALAERVQAVVLK